MISSGVEDFSFQLISPARLRDRPVAIQYALLICALPSSVPEKNSLVVGREGKLKVKKCSAAMAEAAMITAPFQEFMSVLLLTITSLARGFGEKMYKDAPHGLHEGLVYLRTPVSCHCDKPPG